MNTRRILSAIVVMAITAMPASAQTLKERLKKAAEIAGQIAVSAGTLLPIDASKEIEIGRGIAATVAGRYKVSEDTLLNEYVNLVGLVVAGEAPRTDIAYRFAVLETPRFLLTHDPLVLAGSLGRRFPCQRSCP